jgi:hypothetical protein
MGEGAVQLWDLATGEEVLALKVPHDGQVGDVRFSADGTTLMYDVPLGRAWDAPCENAAPQPAGGVQ